MASQYYRDRVKRGAEWLDKHNPDWHDKLDVANLDIEFMDCCIIGQLHGDYNKWSENAKHEFAISHGFYVRHRKGKNWKKQTKAWVEEIQARRRTVVIEDAVRKSIHKLTRSPELAQAV